MIPQRASAAAIQNTADIQGPIDGMTQGTPCATEVIVAHSGFKNDETCSITDTEESDQEESDIESNATSTSRTSLNTPDDPNLISSMVSTSIQEIVDDIIDSLWFSSVLRSFVANIVNHPTDETNATVAVEYGLSNTSSSTGNHIPGRKRAIRGTGRSQPGDNDDGDDDDESDDEKDPKRPRKLNAWKRKPSKKLACPYLRRYPQKFGLDDTCRRGWPNIHRLKYVLPCILFGLT
jgi:hypothetical protein